MIEVANLWKSYGSFHALLGIGFTVARGEILGFLGPNGAGKTTAMKILTGYLYPTSGDVRVGGRDVVTDSLAVRRMIGYLPESTPLYGDMTVTEYLRFCSALRGMRGERAGRRIDQVVGLTQLEPKLVAPIKTLSKGYRQRVGIAQALLHEPEVLILDEPTVGLDPNQVVPVREIIRDVGRDRTVILCSHILPEVEAVCGRVIIINEGRIAGDGTVAELAAGLSPDTILDLRAAGDGAALKSALSAVPGVTSVEIMGDGGGSVALCVRAPASLGTEVAGALAAPIMASGGRLLELSSRSAKLEDVFRNLTARSGAA